MPWLVEEANNDAEAIGDKPEQPWYEPPNKHNGEEFAGDCVPEVVVGKAGKAGTAGDKALSLNARIAKILLSSGATTLATTEADVEKILAADMKNGYRKFRCPQGCRAQSNSRPKKAEGDCKHARGHTDPACELRRARVAHALASKLSATAAIDSAFRH